MAAGADGGMASFDGRVAVITGGASGIGLAVAQALRREGARLVLADIEAAALDKAIETLGGGPEVIGVVTDVGGPGFCPGFGGPHRCGVQRGGLSS